MKFLKLISLLAALMLLVPGMSFAASYAYVANSGSNNVSVINTATNAVIATVPVGINPYSVGKFIWPDLTPAAPTPVPTLSEWATITLAMLIGGFGVYQQRRRRFNALIS